MAAAVVLDVEPVAHVQAVAVDRQRLVLEGVGDHQRDQLLGKLVGAVVVAAARDHDRQAEGVVVGAAEQVGRGLASPSTGELGAIGDRLGEGRRVGAERAVDLVGGDLHETADALRRAPLRAGPSVPRTLVSRKLDGASMERSTWLSAAKFTIASMRSAASRRRRRPPDRRCRPDEAVARVVLEAGEVLEVAGVGQQVEVDDAVVGSPRAASRT